MLATNLSEANGPDDKLRMAFKMYDKDSSGELNVFVICLLDPRTFLLQSPLCFILGTIEIAEMTEIVVNLFELEGIEKVENTKQNKKMSALFPKRRQLLKRQRLSSISST